MEVIKITDSGYPRRLIGIKNPPKTLYVQGNIELLNKQSIAIVGTRNPTEYGKKLALKFAKELSEKNICVISGLAQGIDTYAHFRGK